MKIIVDDAIPYIHNRISSDVEIVKIPGKEFNKEIVRDADALIVRTRTKCNEKLLKGSKVKLVATATIGTDHIDMEWCEKNGITVKSAPGCNAPGVAQYVLAALLEEGLKPGEHTLGIIGYGNVGTILARWATQLGFKTLISDEPRRVKGFKDKEYLRMKEVLQECEAVTLHVPYTEKGAFPTKYLIGDKELQVMKPGAILVNSSRGGVVDEAALKQKLGEGSLKAIIDVWENEPLIDSKLVDLAAIATPHIAGYSEEGKRRATKRVLEALHEVLGIEVNINNLIKESNREGNEPITTEMILKSYNPSFDSNNLKKDISSFENLRNTYLYRHEPLSL